MKKTSPTLAFLKKECFSNSVASGLQNKKPHLKNGKLVKNTKTFFKWFYKFKKKEKTSSENFAAAHQYLQLM